MEELKKKNGIDDKLSNKKKKAEETEDNEGVKGNLDFSFHK